MGDESAGVCWSEENDHYPPDGTFKVDANIGNVTCAKCLKFYITMNDLKKSGAAPSSARTDKDYAIEHGGYLATAAEYFLAKLNDYYKAVERCDPDRDEEVIDNAQQEESDAWQGLNSAIYEFRKRAERAIERPSSAGTEPPPNVLDDPETWRGIDSGEESAGLEQKKAGEGYDAPLLSNEPLSINHPFAKVINHQERMSPSLPKLEQPFGLHCRVKDGRYLAFGYYEDEFIAQQRAAELNEAVATLQVRAAASEGTPPIKYCYCECHNAGQAWCEKCFESNHIHRDAAPGASLEETENGN